MNKDASGASPRIQGRIAVTETRFSTPQGDFDLERYPVARNTTLRAWDAADAFLLGHVADVLTGAVSSKITVLNDAFGALTVALSADRTVGPRNQVNFVSDSHLAWLAMLGNLARNGMAKPSEPEPGGPDLVLVKIPKTLALLETQLVQLRQAITPKTVIVGGGMTRDVHSSTLDLFARILGPTRTSRAKKKARLIFSTLDAALSPEPPAPTRVALGRHGVQLVNYPGVFSGRRLDNGTRLMLDNLPVTTGRSEVIDLGSGSGALGVAFALDNPGAHILFVDESHLAVRSAEATFRDAFAGRDVADHRWADFRVGDCLDGLPDSSADLILNNPPFHQGRATGDDVAWKMFTDAKRVLRRGGEVRVVGNRHLNYDAKLRRVFGNSEVVAANSKFVVIRSVR